QATSVFAKSNNMVVKKAPFSAEKYTLPSVNEEEAATWMKASEKKRKPANSSMIDESMMSKELKAARAHLYTIKTSEAMEAFLNDLDKNYDSSPTDLKFYITQMMPTKAFRGIFYRLKPLFEGKSNFVHSQILTTAKGISTRTNVFLPYDHAEAGFEYVSSPYLLENGNMAPAFEDEMAVQIWMAEELLPLVRIANARLEKLNLTDAIVWDQKMVFGNQSFADGINRFKLIGEFEKNLALSASYGSITAIATMRAYSVENSVKLYKDIGFLYGFDGFGIFNKIDGVSAEKVAKQMRKATYNETGKLLPDGKDWMKYAYNASLQSLKAITRAWNLSSDARKDENLYVFNTNYIGVNRDEIHDNLEILNRVITSKDAETLRSGVTGEVVQLNYSKLFLSPPEDLKSFLPTKFDENKKSSREVTLANGSKKTLSYRNYAEGSAIGWDLKKFENYFPSIKSNDDVYRTVRVLNHIQGNWLVLR
ncbi:MAG: hypothetical protein K2Q18_00705, partial [Bdellovibrionales bacterium]|nr:hypothetical protein [Bdellovibrionales bacterium]